MDPDQLQRRAYEACELLRAFGNPHRLMVLCQLLEGEKSVGELVRAVGLSQSALSQHLARLRREELVRTRRSAQTIYYALAGSEPRALLEALHRLYCRSEDVEQARRSAQQMAAVGDPPALQAGDA